MTVLCCASEAAARCDRWRQEVGGMPTFGTVPIGKARAQRNGQTRGAASGVRWVHPRHAPGQAGKLEPGESETTQAIRRKLTAAAETLGRNLEGPAYRRSRLLLGVGRPASRQAPQKPVRVVPSLRGLTHRRVAAGRRTLVGASGGPAVLAALQGRQYHQLPSIVAQQLGHVPSPEAVPVLCQPVAEPCRAGRRSFGCQQPSHQSDNLVAGERHVAHQQACLYGQGGLAAPYSPMMSVRSQSKPADLSRRRPHRKPVAGVPHAAITHPAASAWRRAMRTWAGLP